MTYNEYRIIVNDAALMQQKYEERDKSFWVSVIDMSVKVMNDYGFFYFNNRHDQGCFLGYRHTTAINNQAVICFMPMGKNEDMIKSPSVSSFFKTFCSTFSIKAHQDYGQTALSCHIDDDNVEITYSVSKDDAIISHIVKIGDLSARSQTIILDMIPDIEDVIAGANH